MRRKSHRVMLARRDEEQAGPSDVWDMIQVDVSTFNEEGQMVAVCEPLESCLVGIGTTHDEALADFVEGLKALVDFHKSKGQFPRFMLHHFDEGPVKVVMPRSGWAADSSSPPELHFQGWNPERLEPSVATG